MIVPLNDTDLMDNILPLIRKIENFSTASFTPEDYLEHIRQRIASGRALLLVNINDANEVDSFIYAEITYNVVEKNALVSLAYFAKGVDKEMRLYTERWARMMGCSHVKIVTDEKHKESYMRKYDFTESRLILSKPLGGNNA
jgi:hypothetical protein